MKMDLEIILRKDGGPLEVPEEHLPTLREAGLIGDNGCKRNYVVVADMRSPVSGEVSQVKYAPTSQWAGGWYYE
jgi:hypothetical protein